MLTLHIYYDLGLRVRVGKVLGINFPITQSTELKNILKSRGNYLNRISFTIDINEMRPARILGEFGMM